MPIEGAIHLRSHSIPLMCRNHDDNMETSMGVSIIFLQLKAVQSMLISTITNFNSYGVTDN